MPSASSIAVQIADEIAALLNNLEIGDIVITCTRKLIVDLSLAEAKTLQVLVVPHSLESKIIDRGLLKERSVLVDIGIMKRAAESELESLIAIAQAIGDTVEGVHLTSGLCTAVSYNPIYDSDTWLRQHSFLAVVTAKVKVFNK